MDSNVQLVKNILKYTFGLVPIVAGLDKFTNILTNWSQYISEGFAGMLPFEPTTFMMIVGIIEIVAGILVLTKTKLGAYVVSAWLAVIALTLISTISHPRMWFVRACVHLKHSLHHLPGTGFGGTRRR